jgi:hypothetical protein
VLHQTLGLHSHFASFFDEEFFRHNSKERCSGSHEVRHIAKNFGIQIRNYRGVERIVKKPFTGNYCCYTLSDNAWHVPKSVTHSATHLRFVMGVVRNPLLPE